MYLSNQSLLVILVVGIVAGWLAGRVMAGGGFGLIGDLIVGLIGAFIGDFAVAAARHSSGHGYPFAHIERVHRRSGAPAHPSPGERRWRLRPVCASDAAAAGSACASDQAIQFN